MKSMILPMSAANEQNHLQRALVPECQVWLQVWLSLVDWLNFPRRSRIFREITVIQTSSGGQPFFCTDVGLPCCCGTFSLKARDLVEKLGNAEKVFWAPFSFSKFEFYRICLQCFRPPIQ